MATRSRDARGAPFTRPSAAAFVREGMSMLPRPRLRRATTAARAEARTLPVLLVPGLMAADWTMRALAQRLQAAGYRTFPARIGLNIGCTTQLLDSLERSLERLAREHGPVAVVGWSRGGTLGKLLALRRPELVAGLVTLASPNVNPLAFNRMVDLQLRLLNRLHSLGARTLLSRDCLSGACSASVREQLLRDFPSHIPYVSFYSKSDGVVDWRACCDPAADLVEVRATHMQMGVNRAILEQVVQHLDRMS